MSRASKITIFSLISALFCVAFFHATPPVRGTNQSIFTVSVWVKPATSAASKAILGKAEELRVATNASSQPVCQIKSGASWQTAATSSVAISVDAWSHVACTYDLAYVRIYVNGVEKGSQVLAVAADDTAAVWKIGRDDSVSTPYGYFGGQVDEFKFFNSALSPEQVKLDMNQGKSMQLGGQTSTTGATGQAAEYCVPGDATSCAGPVGEWKFDEKTGVTANDTSGNGNDATLTNAVWDRGKYGSGRKMTINSSTESSVVTDPASGILDFDNTQDFTLEIWFKGTAAQTDAHIIHKGAANTSNAGYMLRFNSSGSQLQFRYTDGNGSGDDGFWSISTPNLLNNNWHHVAVVMDRDGGQMGASGLYMYVDNQRLASDTSLTEGSGVSTSNLSLGEIGDGITGTIDQVQIFNYARTPAQIAWDYNRGKPVGWWKMDEGEGGSAYDSSGFGNTGTLTSMDPPNDWVDGKFGKALDFDGSNDYVTMGNPSSLNFGTGAFTVAGWVKDTKPIADNSFLGWASKGGYSTGLELRFVVGEDGTRYIGGFIGDAQIGGAYNFSTDTWYHVVLTRDSSGNWKEYINGVQKFSGTNSQSIGSSNWEIGRMRGSSTYSWQGQIDDVRVYNYALTAEQVKQVMNEGSAVRFGE